MNSDDINDIKTYLSRIADALDGNIGGNAAPDKFESQSVYLWQSQNKIFEPIENTTIIELDNLIGIDYQIDILMGNTAQFANGYAANNALLWGARGTGKSAVVKAIHKHLTENENAPLILIEIHREDISDLEYVASVLKSYPSKRFILFCDDLSFDEGENSYKSLKSILEGGVVSRPDNIIFYATSNRRHLMPRQMIENERKVAIHPGEAVEEKVSLSDRFGLWLGFHSHDQDSYLKMIDTYCAKFKLTGKKKDIHAQALEWSRTRGNRSGRVAWQFIQDLAGRQKKSLEKKSLT